ncbi:MAG: hypothetical protein L6408_09100 [Nanoarchaeota archaeon]|nr:hypothetical protein [Nanoarchaeota archaeon]
MKVKGILIGAAILASTIIGDYCNVGDRFIEPLRYRNTKVDSESYQKPFELEKKYVINEEGNLEVYIGYDHEWYKVDKNLRVNERTLGELLKDESGEIKDYLKEKSDDIKEWYNKKFGEEENGKKICNQRN